MTNYNDRLEALEAKLEREGLTEVEKAELSLIRTQLLREARENNERSGTLLAQMLANIEKIKKFH